MNFPLPLPEKNSIIILRCEQEHEPTDYQTISVVGSQFGDEGKGKLTDYLATKADMVVRYQGGNNAGHSVEINGVRHALRSLPSGIYNPQVTNVIANGTLLDELDENIKS